MSVNKVLLIGNVGRDPEIRHINDGRKIANFSLATSEYWTKDGEKKEKTEWHRIVVFNDHLCDFIADHITKGCRVYLEGQLQSKKWVDKDEIERSVTEVIISRYKGDLRLLDKKKNTLEEQNKSVDERNSEEKDSSFNSIPF